MWSLCQRGESPLILRSPLYTFLSRYDFFLVSQSVRQGTVNPTSYNVIKDTSGKESTLLVRLTDHILQV